MAARRKRARPSPAASDPAGAFSFVRAEERDILVDKLSRTAFSKDVAANPRKIVGFNAVVRKIRRGGRPLACLIPYEESLQVQAVALREVCGQHGVPVLAIRGCKDRLARAVGAKRALALAVEAGDGDGAMDHMLVTYIRQLVRERVENGDGGAGGAEEGDVNDRGS